MAVLTIRELPDDLQEFLKADAAANHRSVNKQVIVALDEYRLRKTQAAAPALSKDEKVARIRAAQAAIARLPVLDTRTPDEILGYDARGLPT